MDEDADQAYYPDPAGSYPRGDDMADALLSAASKAGDTVWLGLANVSAWQSHAGDSAWLTSQLTVQERTADQLYKLYGSSKALQGWYMPFEVSDEAGRHHRLVHRFAQCSGRDRQRAVG